MSCLSASNQLNHTPRCQKTARPTIEIAVSAKPKRGWEGNTSSSTAGLRTTVITRVTGKIWVREKPLKYEARLDHPTRLTLAHLGPAAGRTREHRAASPSSGRRATPPVDLPSSWHQPSAVGGIRICNCDVTSPCRGNKFHFVINCRLPHLTMTNTCCTTWQRRGICSSEFLVSRGEKSEKWSTLKLTSTKPH